MLHTYTSIAAELERRIRDGELRPGDQLPTYAELAKEFSVGHTTVGSAVRVLRMNGLVEGHPPRGVFVAGADPRPRRATG